MADMNVKGGYFAPSNYLKVNEGGTHDENPNGGVQIGVDQNGTPNMLEEGEPVYNDFVYSDNIVADAEFLEKHNLPKKYEGWLYSRIADDLFEEYSETPLDPLSKNGADVMLTRLAECQEEQKQVAEERELEQMLANLSPEEQQAFAQMVAAQQAQQAQPSPEEMAMAQQGAVEEAAPVADMSMQVTPEQMQLPIMAACGGKIHRYDDGGKKDNWLKRTWNQVINIPFMSGTPTAYAANGRDVWRDDNLTQSTVGNELEYAGSILASLYSPLLTPEGRALYTASKNAKILSNGTNAVSALDAAKDAFENAGTLKEAAQNMLVNNTNKLIEAEAAGKVGDANAARELIKKSGKAFVYVVSQTTFSSDRFDELAGQIREELKDVAQAVMVDKTICRATENRQEETKEMSSKLDYMVIIGGKNSSNTNKLYDIASKNCKNVFLAQTKKDLRKLDFEGAKIVGIMAGASTPDEDVQEIKEFLEKI